MIRLSLPQAQDQGGRALWAGTAPIPAHAVPSLGHTPIVPRATSGKTPALSLLGLHHSSQDVAPSCGADVAGSLPVEDATELPSTHFLLARLLHCLVQSWDPGPGVPSSHF